LIAIWVCALTLPASAESPAKSVILLIGDGMGVQIVSVARLYAEREQGVELNMIRLANRGTAGLVSTNSANKLVTDSAASGTALATGVMTDNGVVGMDPDGQVLRNIFEIAVSKGKSVGVVTTSMVTDATPAVFLAHARSRQMHDDIARQIVEGPASVVLGGGGAFFRPPPDGDRKDADDLFKAAAERGFDIVTTAGEMKAASGERLLGLFSPDVMPYELGRDTTTVPSLADMTLKALDILDDDPDGFMLMVEGGRIDHAEHENSIKDALADLFAFDEAVGQAMAYQEQDSTVAVVVTADHETGGPAITGTSYAYPGYDALEEIGDGRSGFLKWISNHHTATMVPVFAAGPRTSRFDGVQHNTEINAKLAWALGF
jgi:alkaline phosphatase